MRLLKENTVAYESFTNSVQYLTKGSSPSGDLKLISFETHNNRFNQLEKYNFLINNLSGFQKSMGELKDSEEIHNLLSGYVKKIIVAKEVDLFLFDESKSNLIAVNPKVSVAQNNLVSKAKRDGIIDWLFESKKPTLIPELNFNTGNGLKLCQTLFPVVYNNTEFGILSLLGPANKVPEDSLENQAVQVLLGIVIPKMILNKQKKEIGKLLNEVQVYQSKLNNQLRIYAVGEYAEGILQDIQNALQMILSSVDFMAGDDNYADPLIIEKIKERIHHIKELSLRLMKFNEVKSTGEAQNIPCNLNSALKEIYGIAEPTLKGIQLECELDLEQELPQVVSSQKHLKQITTNIFSLIKRKAKRGSGLFIQSRSVNDTVVLSFFLTDYWKDINTSSDPIVNLTVRIVKELMKKNDGAAEFDSLPMKGTTIHLLFPIKRKIKG